jgi:hypothetical protein
MVNDGEIFVVLESIKAAAQSMEQVFQLSWHTWQT